MSKPEEGIPEEILLTVPSMEKVSQGGQKGVRRRELAPRVVTMVTKLASFSRFHCTFYLFIYLVPKVPSLESLLLLLPPDTMALIDQP